MAVGENVVGILVELSGKAAFIAGVREEQAAIKGYAGAMAETAAASDTLAASEKRRADMMALAHRAMAGVALLTAGVVIESVKAAIKMEELGKTVAQQTGLTGQALTDMMTTIEKSSEKAPYAINEIADAAVLLSTKFQMTDQQVEHTSALLVAFSKRAEGTAKDVGTTMLSILQDFKRPMSELEPTMDKLVALSQATQKPMGALLGIIEKYGPKLQAMGFGLNDTIKMLGIFQASGIPTSMMGRGLSASLTKAMKESEKTGEGIPDIINRHMQEIKGATSAQEAYNIAIKYFGAQVGPSFAQALYNNVKAFEQVEGAMGKTGGTQQLLDAATKTLSGEWQKLKNILTISGAAIGKELLPVLVEGAEDLASMVKVVMELTDHGKLLVPILGGLTVAWIALDVAMAANPAGAVIFGLVALGVAVAALITHFQDVVNFLRGPWGTLVMAGLLGPFAVVPIIALHIKDIRKAFGDALNWITTAWRKLGGVLAAPFEWLFSKAQWVFDHIKKEAQHLPSNLLKALVGGIPLIGGPLAGAIPAFASGGTMGTSGLARVHQDETVWLPGGASVEPSPATSLLAPRAHTPNPTPTPGSEQPSVHNLEAVLVMPDGRVLASLVTKELTAKKSRL
jgi:hypothetical protein